MQGVIETDEVIQGQADRRRNVIELNDAISRAGDAQ